MKSPSGRQGPIGRRVKCSDPPEPARPAPLRLRRVWLRRPRRDARTVAARPRPARGNLEPDGGSDYALALAPLPARARVLADQLADYDANITAHSGRLRMTGEHGRTWKPHQYLALLFSEHYLRRYFDDAEALRWDLNVARRQQGEMLAMPEYTRDDLRVLAFQSATGSGKTLLMHAHILQYRHYLDRAGG